MQQSIGSYFSPNCHFLYFNEGSKRLSLPLLLLLLLPPPPPPHLFICNQTYTSFGRKPAIDTLHMLNSPQALLFCFLQANALVEVFLNTRTLQFCSNGSCISLSGIILGRKTVYLTPLLLFLPSSSSSSPSPSSSSSSSSSSPSPSSSSSSSDVRSGLPAVSPSFCRSTALLFFDGYTSPPAQDCLG
ncbi:hypothetical protein SprV_0100075500 [Sparganum proliferum]